MYYIAKYRVAMSGVTVKKICDPVKLGEGPHWDPIHNSLLFVDINSGDVHRYYTESGRHQVLHVEDGGTGPSVTLVLPVEGAHDYFVVSVGCSLAFVKWTPEDPDEHTVKPAVFLAAEAAPNRFNDGKCDPAGRIWAGTMASETSPGVLEKNKGNVYFVKDTKSSELKIPKVSISNGLAWSADKKTFYYIDSLEYAVHSYNYDHETGHISNKRTVIDYKKTEGLDPDIPDGMTIDVDGNLWIANYYGKKVICVDPEKGEVLQTVEIPARCVTSVCWGGPSLDVLYVTTATPGATPEELETKNFGATYSVTGLKTKGALPHNFKVDLEEMMAVINKSK